MSNVRGNLVCEADGTGTVTAQVSGTNVKHDAIVSLNGQDGRALGPGNHSYTLTANFPNGTKVFLNVFRPGTDHDNVLIKVLTVDCPQPTTTTAPPTTAPPTTATVSSNPPVTVPNVSVEPPDSRPTLPATGESTVPGALAAGGIILAGAILVSAARRPRRKVQ